VAGLLIHISVYVSVNLVLVYAWLQTTGSQKELDKYLAHPADAIGSDFWPLLIAIPWAAVLLIHAVTVLTRYLPGSRRRRRRRKARRVERDQERALARQHRHDHIEQQVQHFGEQIAQFAQQFTHHPPSNETADETADGNRDEKATQKAPADTGPQRRWTVVMFTDIARSTALTESMGDEAWAEVLADYRVMVRRALDAYHGREVGTQGDGFLCRFDDPDIAVEAAIQLQRALHTRRSSGAFIPDVRVGIHAGEAIDHAEDLVGNAVNLAARVMAVAEPGEIIVTEPVADHLRPGRHLEDRGLHELKGVARPRHLLMVSWRPEAGGRETVDQRAGDDPSD
jgi:class 3 adenylate cyclase